MKDASADYSLFEAIGEGGMGTVHLALEHLPDGSKRRVAIKRMRPAATKDPRNLELFFREARLASLLKHPNVVHGLSFGRIGDEPYIAMEYVEGKTLDSVLNQLKSRGNKLDLEVACFLVAELCEGLAAVHGLTDDDGRPLGVVHRDVTPHNVIVSFDGTVRLLDFGIAKVTEESSKLTRTGEVRGKMAYMSPEQALGERVDAKSDLFGVGAVLYECVTGKRMWGEGSELELMRKLALETPPSLQGAGCPRELAILHDRLVAKKTTERPESAKAVARELHGLAGTSAKARLREVLGDLFEGSEAAERVRHDGLFEPVAPPTTSALSVQIDATPPSSVSQKKGRFAFAAVAAIVALGGLAIAKSTASSAHRDAHDPPVVASTGIPHTHASGSLPVPSQTTPSSVPAAPSIADSTGSHASSTPPIPVALSGKPTLKPIASGSIARTQETAPTKATPGAPSAIAPASRPTTDVDRHPF